MKSFLGEGARKKVYLYHDNTLDRDIAFSLVKIQGLDDMGEEEVLKLIVRGRTNQEIAETLSISKKNSRATYQQYSF